jgi:SAM-dependent methyltransferase
VSSIKKYIFKQLHVNENEIDRNTWIREVLRDIPPGLRILDAGAGELRNKPFCSHLEYVSQDFCQYEGLGDATGLQTGSWDTTRINLVCDIVNIPELDASFDVVLCSEVFEHLPDPLKALEEFSRLLKPGGKLIVTAPFASFVHFAPYHFASGFSKYWYEHHLPMRGLTIQTLSPNGDWFSYARQELLRLPSMARRYGDWCWPLAYVFAGIGLIYFSIRGEAIKAQDVACFGWHCIAEKQ